MIIIWIKNGDNSIWYFYSLLTVYQFHIEWHLFTDCKQSWLIYACSCVMPGTMANLWLIPYGCDGRQILSERQFEPVGLAYEVRLIRDRLSLGVPVGPCLNAEKLSLTPSDSQSDLAPLENQVDPETPAYLEWLKNLNPAEFKSQDHYKVLGDQLYTNSSVDLTITVPVFRFIKTEMGSDWWWDSNGFQVGNLIFGEYLFTKHVPTQIQSSPPSPRQKRRKSIDGRRLLCLYS